ncbi:hypothetical protein ONE63_009840 [Megalurothrips usitatus]|uniref:N-acetylgalactosamine kinase n=1 Tax=Megalurothrips usitatus TaxID=439358 RepID=A0AAV7XJG4_9NEOP|nr:hypothetical protein ONE63_009840 [Megalurothrips usitatus]
MDTPAVISLADNKDAQLDKLIDKFEKCYGSQPSFVVRVPGRVNLIGEHIDYCGYSVLPMALEQHILIAAKPTEDAIIKIVNADPKYPPFEGDINNLRITSDSGVYWHNYVLCGIQGISESMKAKRICGMHLTVYGSVLPNAGLSSSSALVCAAALVTSYANGLSLSKQDLASLCARSERYIGTEGGGMDQAIAFLARFGCAKHISFKPLQATDVKIPAGLAVLVAHSFAELNKAASDQFNQRVAECRLAAIILAKKSGLSNWREITVLADVQKQVGLSLSDMGVRCKEILSKDVYTKEEACEILELDSNLLEQYLPENTRSTELFKLRQRATHVFEEALRVSQFQEFCKIGGSGRELGHLMNLSHDSLRDLFECSHPQLDELVSCARKSGALGARLTGAGWGGCMVALALEEQADALMSSLKETYYRANSLGVKENDKFIFHSQPGGGAVILQ